MHKLLLCEIYKLQLYQYLFPVVLPTLRGSLVYWSLSAVDEFLKVLVFLYKRYPMNMLKTMAVIAITRKRIATTIHAVCDPPDLELWSTMALPGVWFTVIVVANGHKAACEH